MKERYRKIVFLIVGLLMFSGFSFADTRDELLALLARYRYEHQWSREVADALTPLLTRDRIRTQTMDMVMDCINLHDCECDVQTATRLMHRAAAYTDRALRAGENPLSLRFRLRQEWTRYIRVKGEFEPAKGINSLNAETRHEAGINRLLKDMFNRGPFKSHRGPVH